MSVAKIIEISSQSSTSFEDAIQQGISKAGESVKNIKSAWIASQQVIVRDGKVDEYQVNMRITFVVS